MPDFQFERESYPYIFIDQDNNVQITYPISTAVVDERIAISLDNTCKTGKVCKSFYRNVGASVDNYIRHLTFDISSLTSHQQTNKSQRILEKKRLRLIQLQEWKLLIHDLLALPHVSEMVGAHGTFLHFPSGIQNLLRNQTNIYGVYFRPKEEDSVLRVPNPACTFTRNSRNQSVDRAFSLGQALEGIHITKNSTSSVKVEKKDFYEGALVAVQNKYGEKLVNDEEVNNFLQDVKEIISEQIKLRYPNAQENRDFSWDDNLSKQKLEASHSWYDDYLDITNKGYLSELIETIGNSSLHIGDSLKPQYKSPFNKIDLNEDNYQDKISINVQMFIFIANAIYRSETKEEIDFAKLIEYEGYNRIEQFTSNLVNAFEGNNRADGDIEDFLLDALRDYLIPNRGLSHRKKQEFFDNDSFRGEIKERFAIFSNSILQGMEQTMGTSHADEFLMSFPDQKGDCITHQGNMCFPLSDFLKHQNKPLFDKYFSKQKPWIVNALGQQEVILQKNINYKSKNLPHRNPIGDDAYYISLEDVLNSALQINMNKAGDGTEMMASFLVNKISDDNEVKHEKPRTTEGTRCFFETLTTEEVNLIKNSDLYTHNRNELQNKVLAKLTKDERVAFSKKFEIKELIYSIEVIDQSLLYAYANDSFYSWDRNSKEAFAGRCENEAEIKAALEKMQITDFTVQRRENGGFLIIFDSKANKSEQSRKKLETIMSPKSMHITRDMARAIHKEYQVLFQNDRYTSDSKDVWIMSQIDRELVGFTGNTYFGRKRHLLDMAIKYKLRRLQQVSNAEDEQGTEEKDTGQLGNNDIKLDFYASKGYKFKCSNLEKSRQLMDTLYKLCEEHSPRVPLTYAEAANLISQNSQVVQEVITPEMLTDYFSRTLNENLKNIGHITRITQLPDKSFQIMMPLRPKLDQEKALTGLISEKLLYFYRLSGQQRKILPSLTDVKYHNVNDVTIVTNLENIRKIEKSAPRSMRLLHDFNNFNDEKLKLLADRLTGCIKNTNFEEAVDEAKVSDSDKAKEIAEFLKNILSEIADDDISNIICNFVKEEEYASIGDITYDLDDSNNSGILDKLKSEAEQKLKEVGAVPLDVQRTYFTIHSIHDLKIYESLLKREIDSYITMKPEATVDNLIEYMKIFFPTIGDIENVGNHIYSQFCEMLQASADNSSITISKNLSLAIEQLSSQTQIQEPEIIIGNSDDYKEDYKPESMLETTIGNSQETDVDVVSLQETNTITLEQQQNQDLAEAVSLQETNAIDLEQWQEPAQKQEAIINNSTESVAHSQSNQYYPGKGILVSLLLGLLDLSASFFCMIIRLLYKAEDRSSSFYVFPISHYMNHQKNIDAITVAPVVLDPNTSNKYKTYAADFNYTSAAESTCTSNEDETYVDESTTSIDNRL